VHLSHHCAPYHEIDNSKHSDFSYNDAFGHAKLHRNLIYYPKDVRHNCTCQLHVQHREPFLWPSYKLFCLSGVNCLGIVLRITHMNVNTNDCYGLYTLLLHNLYIIMCKYNFRDNIYTEYTVNIVIASLERREKRGRERLENFRNLKCEIIHPILYPINMLANISTLDI